MIAQGKMGEVDWVITDSGELIIGKEGETQTFDYADSRFSDSWGWYSYRNRISSVSFKGLVIGNGSHENMFSYCRLLTSLDLSNFNTSNVTNMYSMFYYCDSLTSLDLSKINTSNVTNMGSMFNYCKSLISLDLSKINTSNVTYMFGMFRYCENLKILDLSNFNTSKVTNMSYMFGHCNELETIYVSSLWNINKVSSSLNMFYNSLKVVGLYETTYDSSKTDKTYARIDSPSSPGYLSSYIEKGIYDDVDWLVDSRYRLFIGKKGITQEFKTNDNRKDGWPWEVYRGNIISVIFAGLVEGNGSHDYMFNYMYNLKSFIGISNFKTFKIKNMNHMFGECASLTSLDLSGFDTSSVTDMSGMFFNCISLTSLYLSGFNTSNVTNMESMFDGCQSLTLLDLSSFDTIKVTNMNYMFYYCSAKIPIFYVSNCSTQQGGTEDINVMDMFMYFTGEIFLMRPENVINPTGVKNFWREVAETNPEVHFEYDDTSAPTTALQIQRGKFETKEEEGITTTVFVEDDAGGNVIKVTPNIEIKQDNIPNYTKVGKNTLTSVVVILNNGDYLDYELKTTTNEGIEDLAAYLNSKSKEEDKTFCIKLNDAPELQYRLELDICDRREDPTFPFKIIIPGIFAMIEFRKGGHGMSIGKICERDGLEVSIPTTIGEGLTLPTTSSGDVDLTKNQLAIGKYNILDANKAFIIGNGEADSEGIVSPSNALTVDWQGRIECGDYQGNFKPIFDVFYPINSCYTTYTNENPSSWLGGEWVLSKKLFKYQWKSNFFTFNTTNTTEGNQVAVLNDTSIMFRFGWKNKVAISDNNMIIGTFNLANVGITGNNFLNTYITGQADGLNAVPILQTTISNGTVTLKAIDWITRATSYPTTLNVLCNVQWTHVVHVNSPDEILDGFCDRFVWRRIS